MIASERANAASGLVEQAVSLVEQPEVVEQHVVVGRDGGRGSNSRARARPVALGVREPEHVVELRDQVPGEVVLRHPRVVLAGQLVEQRDAAPAAAAPRAATRKTRPTGTTSSAGTLQFGWWVKKRRSRSGSKCSGGSVGAADALQDQIHVGPAALDEVQVHEHEEDVVVGGGEVRRRAAATRAPRRAKASAMR